MKTHKKPTPTSQKLKAIADPTRLSVMEMLMEKSTYVNEFIEALDIEPTLLSHHLSILKEEGLIESEREGKTVLYNLTAGTLIKGKNKGLNLGSCNVVFTGKTAAPKKSAKKSSKKK